MMKTLLCLFLALLCVPACTAKQSQSKTSPDPDKDACIEGLHNALADQNPTKEMRRMLDAKQTAPCVVKLLLLRRNAHVLNTILMTGFKDATENLQQNGASVGSGGSTNLI